jgi:hypothetical protein
MPIRREFRHHYRTEEWQACCAAVDERARGRCEFCGAPEGLEVLRIFGTQLPHGLGRRRMYWRLCGFNDACWVDQDAEAQQSHRTIVPKLYDGAGLVKPRTITVQLGHAHLNQDAGDHRPENVRKLCRWCHLNHDARFHAVKAGETRKTNKDAARPVLVAAQKGETDAGAR